MIGADRELYAKHARETRAALQEMDVGELRAFRKSLERDIERVREGEFPRQDRTRGIRDMEKELGWWIPAVDGRIAALEAEGRREKVEDPLTGDDYRRATVDTGSYSL